MNLQEYLQKEGVSPSAWAKKCGIAQPVITRFLSGKRGLSLTTAIRIQEATGGQVRIEDLVSANNGTNVEPHHS